MCLQHYVNLPLDYSAVKGNNSTVVCLSVEEWVQGASKSWLSRTGGRDPRNNAGLVISLAAFSTHVTSYLIVFISRFIFNMTHRTWSRCLVSYLMQEHFADTTLAVWVTLRCCLYVPLSETSIYFRRYIFCLRGWMVTAAAFLSFIQCQLGREGPGSIPGKGKPFFSWRV